MAVAPRKMRELQAPGGLHHGRQGQISLRGPFAVVHGGWAPGAGLQAAMQERPAQPACEPVYCQKCSQAHDQQMCSCPTAALQGNPHMTREKLIPGLKSQLPKIAWLGKRKLLADAALSTPYNKPIAVFSSTHISSNLQCIVLFLTLSCRAKGSLCTRSGNCTSNHDVKLLMV